MVRQLPTLHVGNAGFVPERNLDVGDVCCTCLADNVSVAMHPPFLPCWAKCFYLCCRGSETLYPRVNRFFEPLPPFPQQPGKPPPRCIAPFFICLCKLALQCCAPGSPPRSSTSFHGMLIFLELVCQRLNTGRRRRCWQAYRCCCAILNSSPR